MNFSILLTLSTTLLSANALTCNSGRTCDTWIDFGANCWDQATLLANGWTYHADTTYMDGCDNSNAPREDNHYFFYGNSVGAGYIQRPMDPPIAHRPYAELTVGLDNYRSGCSLRVYLDGNPISDVNTGNPIEITSAISKKTFAFAFTNGQQLKIEETDNCRAQIYKIEVEKIALGPDVPNKACELQKYRNGVYATKTDAEADCDADPNCIGVYQRTCGSTDLWLCPKDFQQDNRQRVCDNSCMNFKEPALATSSWRMPTPPFRRIAPVRDRDCCTVDGGTKQCSSTGDPHIITFDQPSYWHYQSTGDFVYFKNPLVEIQVRQEQPNAATQYSVNTAVGVKLNRCNGGPKTFQLYATVYDPSGGVNPQRALTDMGLTQHFVVYDMATGTTQNVAFADIETKMAEWGCLDFCSLDDSNSNQVIMRFSGGSSLKVYNANWHTGYQIWAMSVYIDMTPSWIAMSGSGICTQTSPTGSTFGIHANGPVVPCTDRILTAYTLTTAWNLQATTMCVRRRLAGESDPEPRRLTGDTGDVVIQQCELDMTFFTAAQAQCDCNGQVDEACLYDICITGDLNLNAGKPALDGCKEVAKEKAIYDAAPLVPVATPSPIPLAHQNQQTLDFTVRSFPDLASCQQGPNSAISATTYTGSDAIIMGCHNSAEHGSIATSCLSSGTLLTEYYLGDNCELGGTPVLASHTISDGECFEPHPGFSSVAEAFSWTDSCHASEHTMIPTKAPTTSPTVAVGVSMCTYTNLADCNSDGPTSCASGSDIPFTMHAGQCVNSPGLGAFSGPAMWTCQQNGVIASQDFNAGDTSCNGAAQLTVTYTNGLCVSDGLGGGFKFVWSGYCDGMPTPMPTPDPTASPTPAPTNFPTPSPTLPPTNFPSPSPTPQPTPSPTESPTPLVTPSPVAAVTPAPVANNATPAPVGGNNGGGQNGGETPSPISDADDWTTQLDDIIEKNTSSWTWKSIGAFIVGCFVGGCLVSASKRLLKKCNSEKSYHGDSSDDEEENPKKKRRRDSAENENAIELHSTESRV